MSKVTHLERLIWPEHSPWCQSCFGRHIGICLRRSFARYLSANCLRRQCEADYSNVHEYHLNQSKLHPANESNKLWFYNSTWAQFVIKPFSIPLSARGCLSVVRILKVLSHLPRRECLSAEHENHRGELKRERKRCQMNNSDSDSDRRFLNRTFNCM